MNGTILIIGGYGAVGRVAATRLAERYPGQVMAAGRNYDKANELSKAANRKILTVSTRIGVDAQGLANGQRQTSSTAVSGDGEGRITGLVAAQVAKRLIEGNFPVGVFHIEQLFEPLRFILELEDDGLRFHPNVV